MVLQNRCDRLRAGLDLILDQQGANIVDVPAARAGCHFRPAGTALEISSRTRTSRRSKSEDRLRAGLDLILDQRGTDMADLPGGASGMLVRGYKGKDNLRIKRKSWRKLTRMLAPPLGRAPQPSPSY
jgi:hypothetical protein